MRAPPPPLPRQPSVLLEGQMCDASTPVRRKQHSLSAIQKRLQTLEEQVKVYKETAVWQSDRAAKLEAENLTLRAHVATVRANHLRAHVVW